MFSFFQKKTGNIKRNEDCIWFDEIQKHKGIIHAIKNARKIDNFVVVICFFTETYRIISEIIGKENFGSDVIIISNNDYNISNCTSKLLGKDDLKKIQIILPEHYPLIEEEHNLIKQLNALNRKSIVLNFHLSFEDPILLYFGSENIKRISQSLGLKEDECISHGMITKSIQNAQKKISQKIPIEQKTESLSKWFSINLQ